MILLRVIQLTGVVGFLVGGINTTLDVEYPLTHHTLTADVVWTIIFIAGGLIASVVASGIKDYE